MRFGFVEMPNESEAQKAIQNLNGRDINGQKLKVYKSRIKSKEK
jgi:RNA recognition motif-containing protein